MVSIFRRIFPRSRQANGSRLTTQCHLTPVVALVGFGLICFYYCHYVLGGETPRRVVLVCISRCASSRAGPTRLGAICNFVHFRRRPIKLCRANKTIRSNYFVSELSRLGHSSWTIAASLEKKSELHHINCHSCKANTPSMDNEQLEKSGDEHEADQLQAHSTLDPEAKLKRTIRGCLEQSEYLRKVRCDMRKKVLETVHAPVFGRVGQPPREIQLINHLILEYLGWYNLQYTSEMLYAETGTARLEQAALRQGLASSLNRKIDEELEFQPDLPMLAEIVLRLAVAPPSTEQQQK